uniref:Cationic amino acid transporter 4-like n=1 Tax=Saccoglossus kowalevskii TaxID=10224 RepID=A0ABM0LUX9_SACKO|nr:PREDICTED: cationic amino acid transporter 4-like [Saccoglossus kowalevskii]
MAFFSSVLKRLSRLKSLESDNLDTPMKRCLSTFDLTMIGIGSMMGAGLYVLTGTVAKNTAGPAVILSFAIAGFVTLLAAFCYAEFGARIPQTGSAYTYTYVSMGEFWAFLIAYTIVAAGVLVLRYEPAEALTIVDKHKNQDKIEMDFKKKDETSPLKREDSQSHHGGEVRKEFNGCKIFRNARPGTIPAFAVFIMSIFMFTLAAVIVFCGDALAEARFWVIVIVVIFGSVVLLCFFVLCIHYQNTSIVTFKMPLVPLIPSLSIFCNAMLMMNLSYMTWVRFAVWITLGMMLYFCYGIRHSKLAVSLEEDNNDLNRYYIMPAESPCITNSSVDLWQPQSVTTPNIYGSVSGDEEESNVKNKMKQL